MEALVFVVALSAVGHYGACEPQHFGEAKNIIELCLHFLLHRLKHVPQLGSWAQRCSHQKLCLLNKIR